MLFVEPVFFVFFAVVATMYWSLRANQARKMLLLAASYFFYGFWDWRFLALIFASSAIDLVCGARIHQHHSATTRKAYLLASLISNLGILGIFKYLNFFRDSLVELMGLFGYTMNLTTLNIVLPVGISFFTFQSMSYTIDIYRRRLAPADNALDFFLYVAFFPQLVAGPIVRASTFLPQLLKSRSLPVRRAGLLALLFAVGFFKKVAVSDNIAVYIDPVFADPGMYATSAQLLATVMYAIQIYCDFSGYTDMAIASAGLLGYRIPRNFAAPYLAGSLVDFWRRWHISLSTWLRDYLYISLGGNRNGTVCTYRNLMLTMLLGGLWHGASWNFVIWGALHGAGLCLLKAMHDSRWYAACSSRGTYQATAALLGPLITFGFVCLCWIFFRTASVSDALLMLGSILSPGSAGTSTLPSQAWGACVLLLGLHWANWHWALLRRSVFLPPMATAPLTGMVFALALVLLPQRTVPFIYFQF